MRSRPASLRLPAVLVPLVLLTGCMGLARSSDQPEAAGSEEVGSGLSVPEKLAPPPTTSAGGGGGGPDGQQTTTTAPASESSFANEVIRTDPSGFKLILSASGRMRYRVKDDPAFQLEVENVSSRPLMYDSNQTRFFAVKPADGRAQPVWADHMCSVQGSAYKGPPVTLEPGERVTLAITTYPASELEPTRESCRVLTPGKYHLAGVVTWCPEGTLTDGFCTHEKSKAIPSSPLTITFQ